MPNFEYLSEADIIAGMSLAQGKVYCKERVLENEKSAIEAGFPFNDKVYSLSVERGYQLEKAIALLTMQNAPDEYAYEYSDINFEPVEITFGELKQLYNDGLMYVAGIQANRSTKMKAINDAETIEELQEAYE